MTKTKLKKVFLKAVLVLCTLVLLGCAAVLGINGIVLHRGGEYILTPEEAEQLTDMDCILVLGCGVNNAEPSPMLEDRLRRGVELYNGGIAPKLLMSGDHGRINYDEVAVMKQYAVNTGIASSDVFMDHAGFSTYESIYRAKEIFKADKLVIVTQEYHLYRAVYIARALGIEAYGVASDYRSYGGQTYRDMREILARNKDFVTSVFQPLPTYLGEAVPVNGNGDITND